MIWFHENLRGEICERIGLLRLSHEDTRWGKAWKFKLTDLELESRHTFLIGRPTVVAVTSLEPEFSAVTLCFQVTA